MTKPNHVAAPARRPGPRRPRPLMLPLVLPLALLGGNAAEALSTTCGIPELRIEAPVAVEPSANPGSGSPFFVPFVPPANAISFAATGAYFSSGCGAASATATIRSGTAVAGEDYVLTGADGDVVHMRWDSEGVIEVPFEVVDDALFEGTETFLVEVVSDVFAISGGSAPRQVRIVDNDPAPTLALAPAPASVAEGGEVEFTATLSGGSPRQRPLAFSWSVGGGTASAGEDYAAEGSSGRFEIAAGDSAATFRVRTLDDALDEADETLVATAELAGVPDEAITGSGEAAIVDDDPTPSVTLEFAEEISVEEGEQVSLRVVARLGEASGRDAVVEYSAVDGAGADRESNALAGTDFVARSGTLAVPKGLTEAEFEILIDTVEDDRHESAERFSIAFAGTESAELAGPDAATVSVADDDRAPWFQLTLPRGEIVDGGLRAGEGDRLSFNAWVVAPEGDSLILAYEVADGTATLRGTGSVTGDYWVTTPDQTPTAEFNTGPRTGEESFVMVPTYRGLFRDFDIGVGILHDGLHEGDETFLFRIALMDAGRNVLFSEEVEVTIADDDPAPSLTLSAAPASAEEGAGRGTVSATATLSGAATGADLTVDLATADGTARAAYGDYSAASATLTIPAGESSGTVLIDVPVGDDAIDEPDETVSLFGTLLDARGAVLDRTTLPDALTIVDDDDPPSVTLAPARVGEGAGTVHLAASLDGESAGTVTVEWSAGGALDAATAGEDYAAAGGTLVFEPAGPSPTLTIHVLDDDLHEGDESLSVVLESADGTASASVRTVTIADAEELPVATLASVSPSVLPEGGGRRTVEATARLDVANALRDVTVMVDAVDGTARAADGDYDDPDAVELTIPKGETSATASVEIVVNADDLSEGEERFAIALGDPRGASLGAVSSLPVTIADADGEPVVSLAGVSPPVLSEGGRRTVEATARLNVANALRDVTVMVEAVDGTARAADGDYDAPDAVALTIPKGETSATASFGIAVEADGLHEGEEAFAIALGDPQGASLGAVSSLPVTIADGDGEPVVALVDVSPPVLSEDGGPRTIEATARLDVANALRDVTVLVDAVDGTARVADGDFEDPDAVVLTIPKGETSATAGIEIAVAADGLIEGDEAFAIALSAPEGAILGGTSSALVTISDGARASEPLSGPSVALKADRADAREGGAVVVTAVLSAASDREVTVGYATADGTAVAGEDYAAAFGTLTFAPGQTERSFAVAIASDAVFEMSDETFSVYLRNPGPDVEIGERFRQDVTIAADEAGGADPAGDLIAAHLADRSRALLENQPRLTPFLRAPAGAAAGGLSLGVDGEGVRIEGGLVRDGVWGDLAASRSEGEGADGRHFLATAGAHRKVSDSLLLGGMLQFDSGAAELGGGEGEIRGRGWMAGPYLVAKHESLPLRFEGRLLYGRSSNEIELESGGASPRRGSFDAARLLAQARVEGEHRLGGGATLIPLIDLGHVREEAKGFRDGSGRAVGDRAVDSTRLHLGTELEIPLEPRRGDLTLRLEAGIEGTSTGGVAGGDSDRGFHGRVGFGAEYGLEDRTSLAFEAGYSGIGGSRRSLGAGMTFLLRF